MIVKYIFFSPINYMSTLNFQSGVYFGLNRENGNIYRLIEKAPEFLFEKNIYYGLDTSTGNIYRLIDRGVSFNFESNVYYSLDEISGNIYRIKKNAEYIGLIEDYPGISKTRTSIEEELISHGETSTIIDVIKEGMTSLIRDTRGTKTRMILHENSKNNLRDVILRGSNKLNKRVRRRASLKMLFEQNIYVKEFKFNKVDLDLPEKFKKERAIVFRNDETVKIKDLASDEGFYSVLDNNENIHFELGDKLLTYTRNDDGDTERYNLTIGLEGHDDISIEDSPENYNIVSNNNLYVDDEIKINVGGNVRIFLIGSIGDGGIGTVDGSIYLSAGNRVYIDNTQSNTAANTALKIDGGTLIKKDTWFGKDLNIVDNGTILGDTSNLEVEELVGDSPLLIIGENNTGDNLLSGYINRYKNNSNDYKFAGLIRNTINSKPYLLINNISVDNTNKDIDRNDFDLISTNTNNNYKDYYSNLYFNKLKSLSIEGQNNNVSSITTKGSLGISKNVYLGDSNHSNVLINIGNDTQISYNKSNDSKFKFNTNVDIDISSLGNKSISFNSSNDFKYNIINNNDLLISNLYNENINGSSSVMIENDCNEFYAKDLTILAESYGRTYKGSYVIESPVPLMTTYNKDFTKTINNIQDYTNTLESNETYNSNYNITSSSINMENKGVINNMSININLNRIINNINSTIETDTYYNIYGNNNVYISNQNINIINDENKIIHNNYINSQLDVLGNINISAKDNNITYNENKNLTEGNSALNCGQNINKLYNKTFNISYNSSSNETINSNKIINYSNNYDINISGSNTIIFNSTTGPDNYKKDVNISCIGSDKIFNKIVRNNYETILNEDINETYTTNRSVNISNNLNIKYKMTVNETYNNINSEQGKSDSIFNTKSIISNNVNSLVGSNATSDISKIKIGSESDILYNSDSFEKYKGNVINQSQDSNINYYANYSMNCLNSDIIIGGDSNLTFSNNLEETITNRTVSVRPTGSTTSVDTINCVVLINESNGLISSGSIHKKPEEYIPGDIISNITLKENDLILFNYTPGLHNFDIDTLAGNVNNIDYACLNGIYKIYFS